MDLIDRLREKEEQALLELMKHYGDYLVRTAFLLLKDHQTAEEAVQDTFIIAFDKISQLDNPEKLKSWLTSITLNCCRSRMRKWSWKNIVLRFETPMEEEEASSLTPEEELLELAWSQNLSNAIQELDYKYREVITLFYFNEMSISEMASYTNSKENTIKSRLKRARAMLKKILVEGEELVDESEKAIKRPTR